MRCMEDEVYGLACMGRKAVDGWMGEWVNGSLELVLGVLAREVVFSCL